MTGRYQDATVYNLGEIFAQLGATNEGNRERNLARPSGCTFGAVSADVKCQIWQDLVILGPRQTCGSTPCGPGPTDKPSYFFMGLPRSPSVAPQGTPFSDIYAAAVTSSQELRAARVHAAVRLARLEARRDPRRPTQRRGPNRSARRPHRGDGSGDGQGHGAPAVDLLRGRVLAHGRVGIGVRLQWPRDDRRQQVRDPLGQPALPGEHVQCQCRRAESGLCRSRTIAGSAARRTCSGSSPRRTSGSAIRAGQIREVDAVMLAGRDINLVQYAASAATCCDGVSNPLTFNGAVLGLRGTALARDWADPTPGPRTRSAVPRSRRAAPSRSSRPTRAVGGGGGLLAVPQHRIPRLDSSPSIRA